VFLYVSKLPCLQKDVHNVPRTHKQSHLWISYVCHWNLCSLAGPSGSTLHSRYTSFIHSAVVLLHECLLIVTIPDMLLPLVRQDTTNSYQSQGTDIPHLPEELATLEDINVESTHDQDYDV
jgi:hypothetical protein